MAVFLFSISKSLEGMLMEKAASSPFYIVLFFFIRCIVPMLIMLGISYLLRRLGVITEPPTKRENQEGKVENNEGSKGGFAHGNP
jgi:hypothetical protein